MRELIISSLLLLSSVDAMAQNKKNVITVMVDDLSTEVFEDLITNGLVPNIKTHIIDRGLTFNNSFSTNPVCCPSRATYLTGQYSMNNGVLDVATGIQYWLDRKSPAFGGENNTIATWMQKGGYYTGHVGKYLNGYGMNTGKLVGTLRYVPKGYDTWYGLLDPSTYRTYEYVLIEKKNPSDRPIAMYYPKKFSSTMEKDSYPTYWYFKELNEVYQVRRPESYRSRPDEVIAENYQTDVLSAKAIAFFDERDKSRPFFLSLMPMAPHTEFSAINVEYSKKYGYKSHFRETITPAPRHASLVPLLPSPLKRLMAKESFNEANLSGKPKFFRDKELLNKSDISALDEQYRSMMAAMLAVDDLVGDVVKKLKEQNVYDDTVIIFTSDNGYMFGEHRLSSKVFAYEESARVPLIIAGHKEKGTASDALVLNNDLAPTIAEIAGITPERDVDGRSVVKLLEEKNSPWKRKQFLIEHYLDLDALVYLNDIPVVGPWLVNFAASRSVIGGGLSQLDMTPNDFKSIRRLTERENYVYVESYKNKLRLNQFSQANVRAVPTPEFVELYDINQDPTQVNNLAPVKKSERKKWLMQGVGKAHGDLVDKFLRCRGDACRHLEDQ